MNHHDRAYTRKMNWRKALHKRRIVHQYGYDCYDNLHQYSKNSINTNDRKAKDFIKVTDQRKIEHMNDQLREREEETTYERDV